MMNTVTATCKPETVTSLWDQFVLTRDTTARAALIEHYYPLVSRIAQHLHNSLPQSVDLGDLVSAGTLGLIGAVDTYDPGREAKFETFGSRRIRGAMLDDLRAMDWVPRLIRSRVRQVRQATEPLQAALGRKPTEQELADRMALSPAELRKCLQDAHVPESISLDHDFAEKDSGQGLVREIDLLKSDREEEPEAKAVRDDIRDFITRELDGTERLVVLMYYCEQMTLKEIGGTLGVSESRVCQLLTKIMSHVRELLGITRQCGPAARPGPRELPQAGSRRPLEK